MGDRNYSYPTMLAQELLKLGSSNEEIRFLFSVIVINITSCFRDEIYVQVMKQLSENTSNVSKMKGFEVF